jgi:biotin transport system substrate-specific component
MVEAGRTLLLPSVDFDARRIVRDLALMVGFSLLTAASARLVVPLPFTPVPITGQTFGVLLTGALLGGWRGFGAMLIYLTEGMIGLPVLSPSTPAHAGLAPFIGPTGGYLIAFPFAALIIGCLAERGWDRTPLRAFAVMIMSSAVIFLLGAGWLSHFVGGMDNAVVLGIRPFLIGDAVKAALAAALLPLGWKVAKPRG